MEFNLDILEQFFVEVIEDYREKIQEQGEAGQLFRRQKELADEVDKKSLIAKVKSSAGVNSTALSNLLFFFNFLKPQS